MTSANDAQTNSGKAPPWVKMPIAEVEQRLRKVALRTKQPVSRVGWTWAQIQRSAQTLDRGGAFELDRATLALLDGVEEQAVDSIVAAFEASDIGLIVEGRCATFKEKEKSRDQLFRERDKERRACRGDVSSANGLEAPSSAPSSQIPPASRNGEPATRFDPSASRLAAESSESSSSTTSEDLEIPRPVVVESPPPLGETKTTTDDEIFKSILEIDPLKIPGNVASSGVGEVRKWLAEGLDFEADILPELAEIAAHASRPLRTLRAPFVASQVRSRRANRDAQPPPPPEMIALQSRSIAATDHMFDALWKVAGNA